MIVHPHARAPRPRRGRGLSASFLSAVLLLLPLALLPACNDTAGASTRRPDPPAVTVRRPATEDVTDHLVFTGELAASERVEIRARVEGFLREVRFEDGQAVSEGDVLFEIDPREFEAELRERRAEVDRQQARVNQAQWVLDRNKRAVEKNAVSELAVIEAEADLADVRAQLDLAEAAVERAELDLEYATVASPIDGVVGRRLADPGNLVGPNPGETSVLAVVVKRDPIYAYFTVSERELARIGGATAGQGGDTRPIQIALGQDGAFEHDGTLDFTANEIDGATGTLQMRATVPQPEGAAGAPLVPGAFARVRVPVAELTGALTVPEVALSRDQSGDFLYTVDADDTVARAYVQLGPKVGDRRVIADGLGGQERVVVEGIQRATPGAKVKPSMGGDG